MRMNLMMMNCRWCPENSPESRARVHEDEVGVGMKRMTLLQLMLSLII